MPDRMLCAVLEQFQLYFSLWYVRFVSIQSVISSCVLKLKRPGQFFLFLHTHMHTNGHKRAHAHTQKQGHPQVNTNSLYSRLHSLIYWRLGVQYDEDHV